MDKYKLKKGDWLYFNLKNFYLGYIRFERLDNFSNLIRVDKKIRCDNIKNGYWSMIDSSHEKYCSKVNNKVQKILQALYG